MPIEFNGFEQSKVIWEADESPNQAMLQVFKDGSYYLIVNDKENAKHIVFSREKALELKQAIENVEMEQSTLF
jgi:hypothetical protein